MFHAPTQLVRSIWDDPSDTIRREMARVFGTPADQGCCVGKYPVDIREDKDSYHAEAELPGFTKDQINVSLEDGTLTITAQRDAEEKAGESHLTERRFTKVSRSFRLPTAIDESKVQARLDHGVLHLTLPKREEVKPRRIQVV